MTEKGLKKLGQSIELSYSNIQRLSMKHLYLYPCTLYPFTPASLHSVPVPCTPRLVLRYLGTNCTQCTCTCSPRLVLRYLGAVSQSLNFHLGEMVGLARAGHRSVQQTSVALSMTGVDLTCAPGTRCWG